MAPRPRPAASDEHEPTWQLDAVGREHLLTFLLDSTPDHVHAKDLLGRYVFVNRADAEWFGRPVSEILGRTDAELVSDTEAAAAMAHDTAVLESGQLRVYQQQSTRDGMTRTWTTTKNVVRDPEGDTIGLFTITHEITDQLRQEAQLRQAAKMEAIGQLAGGIAHDFNNLLTVITGYSQMALARLAEDDVDGRADLEAVVVASRRASDLTGQLLAFSRRQLLAPRVVDPAEVVAGIAPMLRRLLGEHIELIVRASGTGSIRVDPAQLEQVLLNLSVNARDAMPGGGRLTLATEVVEQGEDQVTRRPERQTGRHVRLSVSDDGTGMDAATRDRIFEPFFTTKAVGEGTGLGLATVYGIVKQLGGWIYVYSELGHGTTFHLYFPCTDEAAAVDASLLNPEPPRGSEAILLVEDEPALRAFARRCLVDLGYQVADVADGEAALALLETAGGVDLLITDVVMPRMLGTALAARVVTTYPGVRVLYLSGFPRDALARNHELPDDASFLGKPFEPHALALAVRAALAPS
jgi:PAS domain S-box-containing protein